MNVMRVEPKISIVTVVLNDSENFTKTANNISQLNYSNFEYIVIDGESTDGTKIVYKWIFDKRNDTGEHTIEENGTILVVASIEQLYFDEDLVSDTGFLSLDKGNVVTINGCDGYALPTLLDRFDYQRPKK